MKTAIVGRTKIKTAGCKGSMTRRIQVDSDVFADGIRWNVVYHRRCCAANSTVQMVIRDFQVNGIRSCFRTLIIQ